MTNIKRDYFKFNLSRIMAEHWLVVSMAGTGNTSGEEPLLRVALPPHGLPTR